MRYLVVLNQESFECLGGVGAVSRSAHHYRVEFASLKYFGARACSCTTTQLGFGRAIIVEDGEGVIARGEISESRCGIASRVAYDGDNNRAASRGGNLRKANRIHYYLRYVDDTNTGFSRVGRQC